MAEDSDQDVADGRAARRQPSPGLGGGTRWAAARMILPPVHPEHGASAEQEDATGACGVMGAPGRRRVLSPRVGGRHSWAPV